MLKGKNIYEQNTYMSETLIVYYSLFQNTANLALEIAIQTGGDIRKLIPDKNYSFDYNTPRNGWNYNLSFRCLLSLSHCLYW